MTSIHHTRIRPATTIAALVLAAGAWLAPAGRATAAPAEATPTSFFSNPAPISIPNEGTASPYPSPISVGGLPGLITDVTVTLRGVKKVNPFDLDILLASPEGDAAVVMSDACSVGDTTTTHTWVFSETLVGGPMPFFENCDESVYRPTNHVQAEDGPDSWPLAPPGSYPADLDSFVGENPNGTWRLFVVDDDGFGTATGSIGQGWSLQLETEVPDALVPGPGRGGLASPYPITRTVGGVDGVISDLNVRLNRAYHERRDDLELLLVGPRGQRVLLMSDACGPKPAKNAFWAWDDEAAASMPDGGLCPSGSYRPSDHEPGDSLPGPAPAAPYEGALSAFDGSDPNGEWRLFAYDDRPGDADVGFFVERFQLEIATRPKAKTSFTEGALELGEGQAGELTVARDSGGQGLGEGTVTVVPVPLGAGAGTDFEPIPAIIEFQRGQQQVTVPVRALADSLLEDAETFAVTLAKSTGDVELMSPSTAVVTIRDDDAAPGGGGSGGGGSGSSGSGSGAAADRTAPETTILRGPKRRTARRTARFRFSATESGVRFECRLDRRKWKRCSSPRTLKRLRAGRHRFLVRAIDSAGNVDPTPAKRRWRVVK